MSTTQSTFFVPADPDNPGVHELAQADGALVVISSADEMMTVLIGPPTGALLLADATRLQLAAGGDLALAQPPQA